MKCIPMIFSGRLVAAANLVIEIDEVFEARMAAGGVILIQLFEDLVLTPTFSVTASTANEADLSDSNQLWFESD